MHRQVVFVSEGGLFGGPKGTRFICADDVEVLILPQALEGVGGGQIGEGPLVISRPISRRRIK